MKDDRLHLIHIIECISRIQEYAAPAKNSFLADDKTQDAVLVNLDRIAESVGRLSPRLKEAHPDVNWRRLSAVRDFLAHKQRGEDLARAWEVVQRDLPNLKRNAEVVLAESRVPSWGSVVAEKPSTAYWSSDRAIAKLLKGKREEILRIAAKPGAHNIRVFGSAARGEDTPESDVDFLVEMEPGRSLLDHVALMQDLEDLLGRKVDVVSKKALHWYIRDRVLQEAVPI